MTIKKGTPKEPDFDGYATRADKQCSDGLTIKPNAFQHNDGEIVPLVWRHMHDDPKNILGHARLENREDGVYTYGYFNSTPEGQRAKSLVEHGDISKLSIYANGLVKTGNFVQHGNIREVSLVLAGANPGAGIENVTIKHEDGDLEVLNEDVIIYSFDDSLVHADDSTDDSKTVQDVLDSMSQEQQDAVAYLVGAALEEQKVAHEAGDDKTDDKDAKTGDDKTGDDTGDKTDDAKTGDDDLTHQKGNNTMTRNVFDASKTGDDKTDSTQTTLSHDDLKGIMADATKVGSLKTAVENYALAHGITNIEQLFPDATLSSGQPQYNSRRMEWVAKVMASVNKSPFSRVKTVIADITAADARAKGYIKGTLKEEEFFSLTSRKTSPTTVYKKQQLDRDDVLDITDLDVVLWIKGEMRMMLDEEIARAVLIGDGRASNDNDKIKDPGSAVDGVGIRSIAGEDPLYAPVVTLDSADPIEDTIDAIIVGRSLYRGSGTPTLYTSEATMTSWLLSRDGDGRRMYKTVAELAAELRVAEIVPVEVMDGAPGNVVGIIVNLADYTLGADKGGQVTMFDDFDIDYNKYKYLLETRVSGALTKIRSAVVLKTSVEGG